MPKGRKIFFIISIISLALSLYSQIAFANEIEIKPVLEGEDYYIMKLGEIQTFQAYGFGWDKDREEKIPDIEIKAVQWSFDTRFLELAGKAGNTITLKATKKRTTKLTVTGKINGEDVTKDIFIVVR